MGEPPVHLSGPSQLDGSTRRAVVMIRRARTPLMIAMIMVGAIVVMLPIWLGVPSLSVAGLGILGTLALSVRAAGGRIESFRITAYACYSLALAAVAYAVFGLDLPPVITVYFPALVVLGAAQILGARAGAFWTLPCVALIGAGVFFAPETERVVSPYVTFGVRAGTLVTIAAFAITFRRAQDRQAAELQLRASIDAMTGLPNRRELKRSLEEALSRAERYGRRGALIFIDLDGLKRINDEFGHAVGDGWIQSAAERLARHTRRIDTPARMGGDEFVVLLSELDDPKGAEVVARKILQSLSLPCEVGSSRSREPPASASPSFRRAHGMPTT